MLVTPAGSSSTGSQDAPPGHGGNHGSPGGVGAIAAARERRRSSAANFESLIIKAARSAEALNNPGGGGGGGGSGSALSPSPSGAEFFRKESSLSLQIPGTGGISPSASLGNKKVTFSQVVDQVKYRKKVIFLFFSGTPFSIFQMACSMSDSSSLSDLSCAEDFKLNVSASLGTAHVHSRHHHHGGKKARKLFRNSGGSGGAGGGGGRLHHKRKYGTATAPPAGVYSLGGGSGSEEVFESSLESIESSSAANAAAASLLRPSGHSSKHLEKIASADSLLSMMRGNNPAGGQGGAGGLGVRSNSLKAHPASTPSSPQLSDNGSSGFPTPLTTPDTPMSAPFFGSPLRKTSSGEGSPAVAVTSPSGGGANSTQVKVEIHDHPEDSGSDSASAGGNVSSSGSNASLATAANSGASGGGGGGGGSGLTLEVPGFHYGKCLSPIKELPSPLPTPSASPLPSRASPSPSDDRSSSSSNSTTSSRRSSFLRFRKKSAPSSKELEKSIEEGTKRQRVEQFRMEEQPPPPPSPRRRRGSSAQGGGGGEEGSGGGTPDDTPVPFRRRYSYACDGSALFQETSFAVPQLPQIHQQQQQQMLQQQKQQFLSKSQKILKRTQSAFTAFGSSKPRPPLVPTITLTLPDCHDDGEEDEEEVGRGSFEEDLSQPLISVTPASPSPSRPHSPRLGALRSPTCGSVRDVSESQLPTNIVIPQVFVSFDEEDLPAPLLTDKSSSVPEKNVSKNSNGTARSNNNNTVKSPTKWRPPPIHIPNSNFKNFFGGSSSSSGQPQASKNEIADARSKPREPTTEMIELREMPRTNAPRQEEGGSCRSSSGHCQPELAFPPMPSVAVTAATPRGSPEVPKRPLFKQRTVQGDTEDNGPSPKMTKDAEIETESVQIQDAGTQVEEEDFHPAAAGGGAAPLQASSPKGRSGSPKFLLAPETFDSTPRSRSQSVELPELRLAHLKLIQEQQQRIQQQQQQQQQQQKQQPTLVKLVSSEELKLIAPKLAGDSGAVLARPVTPLSARRGSRDERLALLLRQRSLAGAAACTNSTLAPSAQQQVQVQHLSFSTSPQPPPASAKQDESWSGVRLGSPPLKRDPPMSASSGTAAMDRHLSQQHPPAHHLYHHHGKLISSSGVAGGVAGGGERSVRSSLRNYDKPQSLDLPCGIAPAITVTAIDGSSVSGSSEQMESDGDSPVIRLAPAAHGAAIAAAAAAAAAGGNSGGGMHYLSPFTIPVTVATCGSRTTSESNLSSSGYSSMASPGTRYIYCRFIIEMRIQDTLFSLPFPGPSRSGSSNPLCISESEDTSTSTPTSNAAFFSSSATGITAHSGAGAAAAAAAVTVSGSGGGVQQVVFIRRPSPLLKSPSVDSESSDPTLPTPVCSASAAGLTNFAAHHHVSSISGGAIPIPTVVVPASSANVGVVGGHKRMTPHAIRRMHEKGVLLLACR